MSYCQVFLIVYLRIGEKPRNLFRFGLFLWSVACDRLAGKQFYLLQICELLIGLVVTTKAEVIWRCKRDQTILDARSQRVA